MFIHIIITSLTAAAGTSLVTARILKVIDTQARSLNCSTTQLQITWFSLAKTHFYGKLF